ncbi:MAG: hypothetical protein HOI21_12100 [Bacteroidetes Order II. Incertae sedis bacterium]|nr:hypothetical protein [Bacteroidetes Order II. bacterium]
MRIPDDKTGVKARLERFLLLKQAFNDAIRSCGTTLANSGSEQTPSLILVRQA